MNKNKCKKIAIDFAMYLLQSKIKKYTKGYIGNEEYELYTPKEFDLMRGELLKNGGSLFDNFIKDLNYDKNEIDSGATKASGRI